MFLKQIPLTKAYRIEQQRMAKATKEGKMQTTGFGKSIASLGIGIAIGLMTELAIKVYDVASGYAEARRQKDLLDKATESGQKEAQKLVGEFEKDLDEKLRELDLESRKAQALEKNEKKKAELREQELKDIDDLVKAQQVLVDAEIDRLTKISKAQEKERARAKKMPEKIESRGISGGSMGMGTTSTFRPNVERQRILDLANTTIRKNNEIVRALRLERDKLIKQSEEFVVQLLEEQEANKDYGVTIADNSDKLTKSNKELNAQLKEINEYLSRQKQLLQEIKQIDQDRILQRQQQDIDDEFEQQLKNAQELGKFDATLLNQMIQENVKTETQYLKQRADFKKQALQDQYDREKKAREQALKDERDALITQAGTNQDVIDKIRDSYIQRSIELDAQEKKRAEDLATEKLIIDANYEKQSEALRQKGYDSWEDLQQQLLDGTEEFADKELDTLSKKYQSINDLVRLSTDFFIQQSQRRVAQIDKEIAKANEQYQTFKQLAINGNIDAEQSLAEQQRIIDQANKKKLEEEKRQQRLRLAQSVFDTYSSKVQAGSKNALSETIRDTQLLLQFINSIPAFYEGTENTGTHGEGVDGKGGFHAILHPNERVIPKSLNDQIGSLTNEQLTQIAVDYKNGRILEGSNQGRSALDFALLVD